MTERRTMVNLAWLDRLFRARVPNTPDANWIKTVPGRGFLDAFAFTHLPRLALTRVGPCLTLRRSSERSATDTRKKRDQPFEGKVDTRIGALGFNN